MARQYDERAYNCLHFAADVWRILTGGDLLAQLPAAAQRATIRHAHGLLVRVGIPSSPGIVVMQAARTRERPHVGVTLPGRTVLHLRATGAERVPIASLCAQYPRMRFYAKAVHLPGTR